MATIKISAQRPARGGLDRATIDAVIMGVGRKQEGGKEEGGPPDLGGLLEKISGARAAAETVSLTGTSDETKDKEHPTGWFVAAAYLLVALGAWLGTMLATVWTKPNTTYGVVDGIGLFAIFYVAAQAMERLMEPLAGLQLPSFGGSRKVEENKRDQNIAKAVNLLRTGTKATEADAQKKADESAGNQARVNQIKNNTQVLVWATASFLSMLLSGAMGLYLLETVGVKGAPVWLNILVTGLAVGAGTEPLHKLIKLIEKKTEENSEEENT
jgi:disulfide bond formation protein DsbB